MSKIMGKRMIYTKQKELADWQNKNFPIENMLKLSKEDLVLMICNLQMALGMSEEVGEISHTVLKGTQGIREGKNGINKELLADGFGDVFIYGSQLMTLNKVDVSDAINTTIQQVLKRDWQNNKDDGEV